MSEPRGADSTGGRWLNRTVHATIARMPRPMSPTPDGPRTLDHRAASGLLAQDWGPAVTMARVAAGLGLAKPTLYKLAGSKEELVRLCVNAETERLLDHLHGALSGLAGAAALEL